jgi:hypothetical protein
MAARYSLTVQIAPPSLHEQSPGHAAVTITTPDGQTYAGLGPAHYDWSSLGGLRSSPSFEPETVPSGGIPPDAMNPKNFSTVFSHGSYRTFTIPITEEQATNALAEIRRIESSGENYDMLWNWNVAQRSSIGSRRLPDLVTIYFTRFHHEITNISRMLRARWLRIRKRNS